MEILEKLEKKYQIMLPKTYKRWFIEGGQKNDSFIGTDIDEPYLNELNDWAKELLEDSGSEYILPENAFVFAMHQGYQFMYFICDGHDDPEVWYYIEDEPMPVVKWKSFSDFIHESV
ncbi:SMI1/KNR4 family protein [Gynuella sunshinyii]|uniref:Knr4/Smi1-like domain-containing protein n=1 Tax=Gynuella sunshinyii YC6258 TaxID=1445510 RepID=A0A0C5VSB5_9GAMM|nr:SMI1/KNR4 family protein [Gynuella sunshinyii]AJQ96213.1 hypothetical Protein YC6258_04177 [Gynuella sunshinyii YC6258]